MTRWLAVILCAAIMLPAAGAQTLYKYRDENGRWQFSDRPPADAAPGIVERETLSRGFRKPALTLERRAAGSDVEILANNTFACPVQLVLELRDERNVTLQTPRNLDTVVPASGTTAVLRIAPLDEAQEFTFRIAYTYMPGDTQAAHDAPAPYRAPFAVGSAFRITQAFPSQVTHGDPGSMHAVDVALPVGTAVYAARAGTVIDIAYDSYSGGTDAADLPKANVVRVSHSDGTIAVYAHLAWNSIRVKPGQRVERGEYLADSGNTGFSSGPHLHFAVQRNTGLALTSVPVTFLGPSGGIVVPASGDTLTAF